MQLNYREKDASEIQRSNVLLREMLTTDSLSGRKGTELFSGVVVVTWSPPGIWDIAVISLLSVYVGDWDDFLVSVCLGFWESSCRSRLRG
jgi:hypothetical protein